MRRARSRGKEIDSAKVQIATKKVGGGLSESCCSSGSTDRHKTPAAMDCSCQNQEEKTAADEERLQKKQANDSKRPDETKKALTGAHSVRRQSKMPKAL